MRTVVRLACVASMAVFLGGCPLGGGGNVSPALKQIPAETQVLLAKKGMTAEAPIFIRIFKEESQLEIWKEKADGRFHHFKTYPICTWSGDLGPKLEEGDKQSPEGFYTVTAGQMNPNSQFHLAFNLGYPNDFDRANGRTGSALMVHGDCRSAGCFAMTDALIEEIYAIAREAFRGGQEKFHVHAYPFRMTKANMKRHRKSRWYRFWKTLKVGYDDFELSRIPPKVHVCSRQYLVNADFFGHVAEPDPASTCPAYRRKQIEPFNPFDGEPATASAASTSSRVASYSSANQTPIDSNGQASGATSQPAETTQSVPTEESSAEEGDKTSGDGDKKSAASAEEKDDGGSASQAASAKADDATERKSQAADEDANEDGPGLHNVATSSKGDMIPRN